MSQERQRLRVDASEVERDITELKLQRVYCKFEVAAIERKLYEYMVRHNSISNAIMLLNSETFR